MAPFAVINSAWARQDTAELDALGIAFLRTELFPVRAHLSLLLRGLLLRLVMPDLAAEAASF
jgi:hypothetical protein